MQKLSKSEPNLRSDCAQKNILNLEPNVRSGYKYITFRAELKAWIYDKYITFRAEFKAWIYDKYITFRAEFKAWIYNKYTTLRSKFKDWIKYNILIQI